MHPATSRLVLGILLVHAAMLTWCAKRDSPTWDEVGHLAAGVEHWEYGQVGFYQVNPPLVRLLASLPVLPLAPDLDWSRRSQRPGSRDEFNVGFDLLRRRGDECFWLFTLARWACIPLSLLGGYFAWRWANELYGPRAGILALVLWCFEPNVLAHGHLITPDAGAAALGLVAAYAFWHWLKDPIWTRTFAAGLTLGLAELTKSTWIVLFVLWPLFWVAWRMGHRPGAARAPWW